MKAPGNYVFTVTPEKAIEFTKLSVILTFTWTPKNNQSRFKILMCTSIFLSLLLIGPLMLSIIKHQDNLLVVIKSGIIIVGILNYVVKVMVVRIYEKELQQLNSSLEDFIANSNADERKTLQKYVDKCWKFHFFVTCACYMTTIALAMGPLVLPQKFPTDATYPFSVENSIIAGIIYLHQCLIGYQCCSSMVLDCQAGLFIWFISVKFDLLIAQTKTVVTHNQLRRYIQNYQNLLKYAGRMIGPTRMLALSTVVATKLGIIISGIFLISNEPVTVKIQFGLMALSMAINIYVCVWPADHLLTISSKGLSDEIFGLTWMHDPKTRVIWTIVLRRVQKPVAINISGLLNTLSHEYYSAFLSAAFSAFATIRAAVNSQ